jgi:hypothetical protein
MPEKMARSDPRTLLGRSGLPGAIHPSHIDFRPVQKTCIFVTSLLQPSKRERCMFGAGGDDTLRKSVPMLSGSSGFIRGIRV